MISETDPISFLVCDRRVPALAGTWPTVATVLREMGHAVTVSADDVRDFSGFDVVLMWNNPGYFPATRRWVLGLPKEQRPIVAVMFAEPLPPPRVSGLPRWPALNKAEVAKILLRDWRATDVYTNAYKLRRAVREGLIDALFVFGGEQKEYAEEQGFDAERFDYGYHENFGTIMGLERDVDVLFLGETRQRRRRRFLKQLEQSGVRVAVRGSWHKSSNALWGEERTRFLNRTKIVVHLQRYPGKVASKRFVLAMANGAMVVSEPCYRPEPFIDGEHYISAPVEQMPEVIAHYLKHDRERERITSAAYRFVTQDLTWRKTMERVIQVIRARGRKDAT